MNPLRKEIESYGNNPIHFLKEATNRLESILNKPLFLPVNDWNDENHFIRELASTYMQKYQQNQRGFYISISAYKDLEHKIRNGEDIPGNLVEVLIHGYIRRIYDNSFGDLVPLMTMDNMDEDRERIMQKLEEMSIFVDKEIDLLASQIARNGNVKRLRLNSRHIPAKTISINDDVYSLGNSK